MAQAHILKEQPQKTKALKQRRHQVRLHIDCRPTWDSQTDHPDDVVSLNIFYSYKIINTKILQYKKVFWDRKTSYKLK